MSRGLGKWERFIMDRITYIDHADNVSAEPFLWSYTAPEFISLYHDRDKGCTPKEIGCLDSSSYSFLNDNDKVLYQSVSRAIHSLEKKGFIKIENVPIAPDVKEDLEEDGGHIGDRREVSFNKECIKNGIPWKLKFLSKRLRKCKNVF